MWETLRKEEVLRKLETDLKHGLTREEVSKRGQKYGKNKLKDKPKESVFIKFIKQFNDFMIIILIMASVISAVISSVQGENDYIDSIIIIANSLYFSQNFSLFTYISYNFSACFL